MKRKDPETAALLIVGDEILSGEIVDENARYMTLGLTPLGIRVREMRVVPDEIVPLSQAMRDLGGTADVLFVSGGIGPTHDDVTRQAVAKVVSRELVRHAEAEARLRTGFGASITRAELSMADLPAGATLLHGKTTPCFGFAIDGIYVLPGVPFFFRDLFDPIVDAWAGRPYYRDELLSRRREGHMAGELRLLQEAFPQVSIGAYPIRQGEFVTRIVVRSLDGESVPLVMDRLAAIAGH